MHPVCKLCRCVFSENENVVSTHCGHVFHKKCMDKWYNRLRRHTCPDCRCEVFHKPLKQVHLRSAEVSPVESVKLQGDIQRLRTQNHVKDLTIAKLRELLKGYEKSKEEVMKLSADQKKLNRELDTAINELASSESRRRDAEMRYRRAQEKLERAQYTLNRLTGKRPSVNHAFTQTAPVIIAEHRKDARVFRRPMLNIKHFPSMQLPKKRPGISEKAVLKEPSKSIFRDPELFKYMTDPVSALSDTFEISQFPDVRQAGKQHKKGGGSLKQGD